MNFKALILGCALAFAAAQTAYSAPAAMQFKHQQRSVSCDKCHGVANPSTPAKAKACAKCHTYDAVAEKTKNMNPNPHDSHAGQLRCTLCHREHAQSVVYCKTCHIGSDPKFNFKVP